jgi:hypothetical protein
MHAPRRTAAALAAAGAALLTAVTAPAHASTDTLTLVDSGGGRVAYVRVYYTDLTGDKLRIDKLTLASASHPDIKYIKNIQLKLSGKGTYSLGTISRTTGVAVGQTVPDPTTLTMTGVVDVSLALDWGFYDTAVAS